MITFLIEEALSDDTKLSLGKYSAPELPAIGDTIALMRNSDENDGEPYIVTNRLWVWDGGVYKGASVEVRRTHFTEDIP